MTENEAIAALQADVAEADSVKAQLLSGYSDFSAAQGSLTSASASADAEIPGFDSAMNYAMRNFQ